MRLLITGATGTLGTHLLDRAANEEWDVRVVSRKPHPQQHSRDIEWVQGDLATGEGIAPAPESMDVVIHLATSPGISTKKVDVDGTRRLVEAAAQHNVKHFLYLSIVGIDDIPYSYYQHKREAERIVEDGDVPHTILRATQFHELVDLVLSAATRMPLVTWLPTDFQVQSIAASEVADHLFDLAQQEPGGRVPDIGGPHVYRVEDMVEPWMDARDHHRKVFRLPFPGKIGEAFREGKNTIPDAKFGTITWDEWLVEDGASPSS